MLLPSAFPCDGAVIQDSIPQRPKLQSFGAYTPRQHSTHHARPGPLSSSCRALQVILGTPATTSQSAPSLPHELSDPFMLPKQEHRVAAPSIQRQSHMSTNKRRRSEFERDLFAASEPSDVPMHDCPQTPRAVRTPKRRRRIPLSMPMGLSADDFRALETPPEEKEGELEMPIISPQHQSDQDSAYGSSPSIEESEWTIEDDRMLVETVLEKLKLSKRDWNDCARILGKDRDTLGRRWSMLVGEGNVGLRRGGRISRTSLDISSW
ncbi:hypothetical protein A1O3_03505 [Capronia epimyces CBS 606.96]|uniref:Myb-like domain-containing protein n=1 Tax=Capronia epimyces CBS 606.96 TaxID=1182542 RepID=W9Y163_9EURO|nr:uncharacterized protein A1O3_03505 [Capronia epimyces CBS 606.96]EXJ86552.1 hypothetical protein A1O3_03505 [Capronia epimyces CBS 606.96]